MAPSLRRRRGCDAVGCAGNPKDRRDSRPSSHRKPAVNHDLAKESLAFGILTAAQAQFGTALAMSVSAADLRIEEWVATGIVELFAAWIFFLMYKPTGRHRRRSSGAGRHRRS